jgi:hypothetical protein
LAYSSTVNLVATYSFETFVDFKRTIRRYFAGDRVTYNNRCENIHCIPQILITEYSESYIQAVPLF